MKKFTLLGLLILIATAGYGQKKVKLKQAETLRGSVQNGVRVDWLIGNVIFAQNQTTIYCDSAIFDRARNSVEAYGRIRITEGDSVTVTSSRLTYDGNKKIAYLLRPHRFRCSHQHAAIHLCSVKAQWTIHRQPDSLLKLRIIPP